MPNERRFYVYVIFRPTGIPCYVGKGSGNRWMRHAKHSNNSRLKQIYSKACGELPIVKIRENLTDAEAIETEIAFIAAIGRGKNGPLVNFTNGGDGTSGYSLSTEARAKIGAAQHARKGTWSPSPEWRAAVSAAKKGKHHSLATREKMRAAWQNNPRKEEREASLADARMHIKNYKRSSEFGKKMSAIAKAAAENRAPEIYKKMCDAVGRSARLRQQPHDDKTGRFVKRASQ